MTTTHSHQGRFAIQDSQRAIMVVVSQLTQNLEQQTFSGRSYSGIAAKLGTICQKDSRKAMGYVMPLITQLSIYAESGCIAVYIERDALQNWAI